MLHSGEFSELIVEQPHGEKTVDGPLPYDIDGFAFSVYLPVQHRIIIDEGQFTKGYEDGVEVARGTVDYASVHRKRGEDVLQVSASPDNYEVDQAVHEIAD